MPYFITDRHPDCSGWAVVKENGDMIEGGCHRTKTEAIDHMVAASINEALPPGGEYDGDFRPANLRDLPDNYRPATSEDVPEGRACGNCIFFNEENLDEEGRAFCERWEEYVQGGFYCNAWQGEGEERAEPGELNVGDFVRWDSSGGTAQGRIERIETDGQINVPDSEFTINGTEDDPAALIRIYQETEDEQGDLQWNPTDTLVGHRFSTLTKIDPLRNFRDVERRQVDLSPPAYMRAAARRGLEYRAEGFGGEGLTDQTIREARAMANGTVTADKWNRIQAWIARHLVDLDAPAADPDHPDYPSPGVVAHLLWGSGPSKRAAERALAYAEGVVARLEEENAGRARGKNVASFEVRVNAVDFDMRDEEDGMRFEGYAAVFNEPSRPLPGGMRGQSFTERIAPGAFLRSLKSRNDIKLLWDHNTGQPLASTRSGTLKLREDQYGLRVTAQLANTSTGRDAAELIRTGVIDAMSFGFTIPRNGDEFNADGTERILREVMLHEVSIVSFPAYEQTAGTTTVRGLAKVAQRSGVDVDALADALLKLENGETMTEDDTRVLTDVLDSIAPEKTEDGEVNSDDHGKAMLELKKKKLQLLMGL